MTDTLEISEAEIDAVLAGADAEAPYGRFKNGKPRKSAPARGTIHSVPSPRKNPGAKNPAPKRNAGPDYEQLAHNALSIPILALSVGGQVVAAAGRTQLGSVLQVDAMTVALASEKIALRAAQLAPSDPKVARFLEKFGVGGGIGELVKELAFVGAQMMVNHGRMAPAPALGLLDPNEVVRRATSAAGVDVSGEPADAVPGG